MKKYSKIISINLILILTMFGIIEYLCFQSYKLRYKDLIEKQASTYENIQEGYKELSVKYTKPKKFEYKKMTQDVYNRVYKGYRKRPIVTIGCSYTEGSEGEELSFAYKLNQMSGRTTYNRGVGGSGPQLVYRQLSDKNFKKEIPDAEYVIYTFIYNHLDRQFNHLLCYFKSDLDISYRINKKGKLEELKRPFWFMYYFFTTKIIAEWITLNINKSYYTENKMNLFYKTMEESVKTMKKNYPDSKLILMEFPEATMCSKEYKEGSTELKKEEIQKLEKLGIKYINAEKLVGHKYRDIKKYRISDEDHPNYKVWDEIVPQLIKELNL